MQPVVLLSGGRCKPFLGWIKEKQLVKTLSFFFPFPGNWPIKCHFAVKKRLKTKKRIITWSMFAIIHMPSANRLRFWAKRLVSHWPLVTFSFGYGGLLYHLLPHEGTKDLWIYSSQSAAVERWSKPFRTQVPLPRNDATAFRLSFCFGANINKCLLCFATLPES